VAAVTLRPIEERDVERAGDVNFVAFYQCAIAHGQRPNVGTPNESRRYIRHLHAFDPLGGILAEENGEIVGRAGRSPPSDRSPSIHACRGGASGGSSSSG
jgi:hypothetical protein